ncbi:RIO kinase 3 (yeast) (predicted), isoform CRA_b [Rattus norvegicus]|uniref:RIO kinase 3 (Yeast) (Predicted), isoform CRA_b n=1 Tax=Rattus norvegicus TaxID=10116 RepID=A6KNG7_RAT|nr:RIO kinase 3 (yeast) (predicted), isoform CRA_b [Rattus norvegicus]EDL86693.1 RIO kinase 3 (yeast) (predicted), isoform CRA_b [Rattus norvegicus]
MKEVHPCCMQSSPAEMASCHSQRVGDLTDQSRSGQRCFCAPHSDPRARCVQFLTRH